jgi:elongation factor Ts
MTEEKKVTAAMVKELRARTDAPMMDCKKALQEAAGDQEEAVDVLRKKGIAKASKRASRVASDGKVAVFSEADQSALMMEMNSETDFVAKDASFTAFVQEVGSLALAKRLDASDAVMALEHQGRSLEAQRCDLMTKLGENIQLRRLALMVAEEGEHVLAYAHGMRIGVMVRVHGGDEALAKDIAMHVAAMNPLALNEASMDAAVLEREAAIYREQAAASGKPDNIIEKMVAGRIQKYLKANTLVHQPFVKNPDKTIADLLKDHQAELRAFVRFELGEGIEKEEKDFAQEVMDQLK